MCHCSFVHKKGQQNVPLGDHFETLKGLDNKHFDFNLIICTIGPIILKGFKMQ